MKRLLNIVGVVLALAGLVWILQGIGLLPGSFMSNQSQWAVIGIVKRSVIVVTVLVRANTRVRPDRNSYLRARAHTLVRPYQRSVISR
jgi:hypothetical protein